jgi:hypothetical protein
MLSELAPLVLKFFGTPTKGTLMKRDDEQTTPAAAAPGDPWPHARPEDQYAPPGWASEPLDIRRGIGKLIVLQLRTGLEITNLVRAHYLAVEEISCPRVQRAKLRELGVYTSDAGEQARWREFDRRLGQDQSFRSLVDRALATLRRAMLRRDALEAELKILNSIIPK